MKTGERPEDRRRQRQRRSLCPPPVILLALLLVVATSLYGIYYKLTAMPSRLQVCDAKLGPLVYDSLNSTVGELKLNVTLCWK